MFLTHLVM
ncbi:hypothetical protein MRX96_026996 [Rhipicephalus microplus]